MAKSKSGIRKGEEFGDPDKLRPHEKLEGLWHERRTPYLVKPSLTSCRRFRIRSIIMRGKLSGLSIDYLVKIAAKAGLVPCLTFERRRVT